MTPKEKPKLAPDQKRAMSDLNCASRKLVALFRERELHEVAAVLASATRQAQAAVNRIKAAT